MKMPKFLHKKIADIINSRAQMSIQCNSFIPSTERMSELCREAASEGIVMLKNEKGLLPLSQGKTVSIFGRVQIDWFFVGYGSGGDVNAPYKTNFLDAAIKNEAIHINSELAEIYADWVKENPVDNGWWANWPMCYDEMPVSDKLAEEMSEISDTAIVIIGRAAGEDRENTLKEGSYFLNENERTLLNNVTNHFDDVVVVLNCGSIMDMSWVELYGDRISSVLYVWQGGMESGNAVCDILTGKTAPSGKLSETIAKSYDLYPSSKNFGNKEFNNYQEDIFVDYRYFETFDKDAVLYPFGFGLTYADFDIALLDCSHKDDVFDLSVSVKNISDKYSGKEVVQVYIEPPQGQLGKESRRLIAFGKTSLLKPNEEEKLSFSFNEYDISSFDDNIITGNKNCYVLEAGDYNIYIGNSVRSAVRVESFFIPKTKVTAKHEEICSPKENFERLIAKEEDGKVVPKTLPVPLSETNLKHRILRFLPKDITMTGDVGIKLSDVKNGSRSLDEFVAQLDFDELEAISRGDYTMNSPLGAEGNAGVLGGVTESLRSKGVPPLTATDGPSGLRLRCTCSLMPNGVALASTFNTDLIFDLCRELGMEMNDRGSDIVLAPGMNIHRNPLCGRNFEYFSADPFLSGKIAAAYIKGVQSTGASACPKHFACNNQETNRTHNDSRVSQRALREIYLKGFEIAVKEARPDHIMTSYNKINGVWSHYNYDLCEIVLRKEWGFEGSVMTDWWMRKSRSPEFPNVFDQGYRIRSGVNVLMPGGERVTNHKPDGTAKKSMQGENALTIGELQRNAKSVLSACIKKIR